MQLRCSVHYLKSGSALHPKNGMKVCSAHPVCFTTPITLQPPRYNSSSELYQQPFYALENEEDNDTPGATT